MASEGALAGKLSPCTVSCGRLGRFGDEAVAHLAQTLDLGLHDIAGFEEAVGALADAATGPATENVAGFERKNARGVFDLLFGREDELRGVAVLLDLAIDGEADEQVHMVGHEGARHQKRPDWSEIVVALAAKPIRAECRPVGADLKVAAGNVVGSHEPGNVFEGALGVDALSFLADGERDLGLLIYLAHAQGDLDVIIGAGKTARRLQEEIGPRGRFLSSKSRPARRRHAGADHLIDVLLTVLRSVEHLPGSQHRGQRTRPGEIGGARL